MAASSAAVANSETGSWRHEDVDSGNGGAEASTSVVRRTSARPSMYKVLDIDHGSGESNEGPDSDYETAKMQGSGRNQSKRFNDGSRARLPKNAKYIIDPKSKFQQQWDIVMMILLIYTATVTPFEVGFLEADWNFLFFLNRFVDLCFCVDLVMQFMTPYYDADMGGWQIDHRNIARNYLRSWFPIDFVSPTIHHCSA